jgi:hypothetical protein
MDRFGEEEEMDELFNSTHVRRGFRSLGNALRKENSRLRKEKQSSRDLRVCFFHVLSRSRSARRDLPSKTGFDSALCCYVSLRRRSWLLFAEAVDAKQEAKLDFEKNWIALSASSPPLWQLAMRNLFHQGGATSIAPASSEERLGQRAFLLFRMYALKARLQVCENRKGWERCEPQA